MKRVAVLRGGPSEEYDVSMKSGEAVLTALQDTDYSYKDIVVTKKGEWLDSGFVKKPAQSLAGVDIVFLALHGTYGEDGQIQRILEQQGIPYTGSNGLTSAIAFNKELTKRTLLKNDLKMPRHRLFTKLELKDIDEQIPLIMSDLGQELFIKPVINGSSLGAEYVTDATRLRDVLTTLVSNYDKVLIEEYIRGKEATVGILDNFRNETNYVLPVVEIVPPEGKDYFTSENKYDGSTEEICPGRFDYGEKSLLSDMATLVHKTIGCRHYSRCDFIIRDGEAYFLEVNTLPGLTNQSLFPKAAEAVGLSYRDLIKHLIDNAHR